MKFAKGMSGNPKGRPKVEGAIRELCRKHGKEAVEVLIGLMKDAENEAVRKAAADSLLDRGYGKAAQVITGADGEKLSLSISIDLGGTNGK